VKRVLFSILGTVVGLVGLLGYKTHPVGTGAASVPPASSGSTATNGHSHRHSTGPSGGTQAGGGNTHRTVQGPAVSTRYGVVQVSVVLAGKKIEQVHLLEITGVDAHSDQIHQSATPVLVKETLSAQSAKIDSVSGATYTSQGYTQSLQSALDRAGA
jgi:uncharacterized protein with FMN-binding domain